MPASSLYIQEFVDMCNACITQWEACLVACKKNVSCSKNHPSDECESHKAACIEQCQVASKACELFIAIGKQHLKTTTNKHKDDQVAEHNTIKACIEASEQCMKACTEYILSCDKARSQEDAAKNLLYCNECIRWLSRCSKLAHECIEILKHRTGA